MDSTVEQLQQRLVDQKATNRGREVVLTQRRLTTRPTFQERARCKMDDDFPMFLEQTTWLLNPSPDRRKSGRKAMQSFPPGTRWILQGDIVFGGDGSAFGGEDAEKIVAACFLVEPGFGRRGWFPRHGTDEYELQQVVGRLLDLGKITLADIDNCLTEEYDQAENQQFLYRHWIRLDPPNEETAKILAEQKRVREMKKEYDNRSGQSTSED